MLYVIASGHAGFDVSAGFAANGYADHSPGRYSLLACLVSEVVMTFMFLVVILGSTDERAPKGLAPIAIGLLARRWPGLPIAGWAARNSPLSPSRRVPARPAMADS